MKCNFGFLYCLIAFWTIGCANNKSLKLNDTDSSSQKTYLKENERDTVTTTIKMENDLLSNYDVYRFTNDTLLQEAYINYITPKQIKFLVRTKNKMSSHKCEYSGIAMMANGEGTAQEAMN